MIILKYGNAKKLESAKRWKCKCSKCGCKVILDKEDVQNYKSDRYNRFKGGKIMEETGYTIVDWLSAGLAVCTILISFMTYLYFKVKLKIKSLKEECDRLKNTIKIREDTFHELTEKYTSLKNDYDKLKEGHTIHEVCVIGAKPIGVSAKLALSDFMQHRIAEEEIMADTKIQLAHRLGIYCMKNNYIHFEESYDPMHNATRLSAYLSVASNNEEIVNVLKPDPILAIDIDKVRELSTGFNCYKRGE